MNVLCRLHGFIDESAYYKLKESLERAREKSLPALIHINSVGGEKSWADEMHALLYQYSDVEKYAVGYEKVHSIALVIFLSCKYRLNKNIQFLIHRAQKAPKETDDEYLISEKQTFEFFASVTNIPIEKYYELADANTYLSYDEAIEKNIVIDYEKRLLL
jgi:ATP-dependent protease ClpP protease subunit